MARCPICGRPFQSVGMQATELREFLFKHPNREIYLGRDNNWHITYTPGSLVSAHAIDMLVEENVLRPRYKDEMHTWTTGKTIDMQATLKDRKERKIGRTDLIYVEPSP